MPSLSRTPAEAVEHYRSQTVRLLSCITNAHAVVGGYHAADVPHRLSLADGEPVRLRGEQHLTLDVTEHYRVRNTDAGWRVQVVAYFYVLGQGGRELVAYHWHPHGRSSTSGPHLHVHGDRQLGEKWLAKIHLPSGAIRLENVVALAIEELGADPLRDDWELLLHS